MTIGISLGLEGGGYLLVDQLEEIDVPDVKRAGEGDDRAVAVFVGGDCEGFFVFEVVIDDFQLHDFAGVDLLLDLQGFHFDEAVEDDDAGFEADDEKLLVVGNVQRSYSAKFTWGYF